MSNNSSINACVFVTVESFLAVEMGSGAVIYVPSFIQIGSGVQKLIRGDTRTHTHGQQLDLISLLYFFQNRKVN
jgi:hypothetical protein